MASKKISPVILVLIVIIAFGVGVYLPKIFKAGKKNIQQEQVTEIQQTENISKKNKLPDYKDVVISDGKNRKYKNNFVFSDMDNLKDVPLSEFKGKLVVLSLWMSGCMDCVYELKGILNMKRIYNNKPVEFIPLSLDVRGASRAYNFLVQHNIKLKPLYMDTRRVVKQYRKGGNIPETIFIGPKGNILGIASQPIDWSNHKNQKIIDGFLKKTGLD